MDAHQGFATHTAKALCTSLFVWFPGDMYPNVLENEFNNCVERFFWKVVLNKAGCVASLLVHAGHAVMERGGKVH